MPAGATATVPAARIGRFPIGRAASESLPFEVLAVPGGKSALLVSQAAEQPTAFARRIDPEGKTGPVLRVDDSWVYRAFDAADGGTTLLSADGRRVCIASYPAGESVPSARGCREASPALAAPIGDRVALFETEIARPVEPARPKEAPRPARHAHAPKESKPAHPAPTKRAPKVDVTVKVRFASRGGEFDAESSPIGLVFKQPQEGLRLLDAQPRAGGVDLLWFEWAPEKKSRSALGGARLVTGFVKPEGTLDKASRIAVTDGDLEYGFVRDRKGARLATSDAGSVLVALDRKPECVVWRAQPKWARLPTNPLLCAIDPARFATSEPSQQELDALLRIEKLEPRRAVGQSKSDFGLVAWAGDRAVFLQGNALFTAPRATGEARAEPNPFVARRSHLRWGAFASDGEGVAVVGDDVVHVAASGEVELLPIGADAARAGAVRAPEEPFERRRAARIGRAWRLARADGIRVFPSPSAAKLPPEVGAVDASAVVGGATRGLLVQVSGEGELGAFAIDAGSEAPGAVLPVLSRSPVRVGFAATARATLGAIVAGVSVADPSRVVAFALDQTGRPGAAFATPLALKPGEIIVRLEALPGGGAWLSDASRTEVIWLDDEARPLASAPWPKEESAASCVDGHAARAFVPSPSPGAFVRVAELAAPGTCLVGEPTWARDGTLRWFASRVTGLDVEAELGIVRPDVPPAPSAAARASADRGGAIDEPGSRTSACVSARHGPRRQEALRRSLRGLPRRRVDLRAALAGLRAHPLRSRRPRSANGRRGASERATSSRGRCRSRRRRSPTSTSSHSRSRAAAHAPPAMSPVSSPSAPAPPPASVSAPSTSSSSPAAARTTPSRRTATLTKIAPAT